MPAETAGEFLYWLFQSEPLKITESPNGQEAFKGKGVYVIWSSDLRPVYVGITSRKFSTRFNEHISKGKIIPGEFASIENIKSPAVAKFLESTFLAAFNFARNKLENGQVRTDLVKGEITTEVGKVHLTNILKEWLPYLENLYNRVKTFGERNHKNTFFER